MEGNDEHIDIQQKIQVEFMCSDAIQVQYMRSNVI